jgi:hypothetical protein
MLIIVAYNIICCGKDNKKIRKREAIFITAPLFLRKSY